MSPGTNKLNELPDRRAGKPHTRDELERWMAAYRASVLADSVTAYLNAQIAAGAQAARDLCRLRG